MFVADGGRAIAFALKVNNILKSLELHNNAIGDKGAAEMAAMIKINQHLEVLNLQYNDIGHAGRRDLLAALDTNLAMNNLYVWDHGQGEGGTGMLSRFARLGGYSA